jgi:hypothetical protein
MVAHTCNQLLRKIWIQGQTMKNVTKTPTQQNKPSVVVNANNPSYMDMNVGGWEAEDSLGKTRVLIQKITKAENIYRHG